MFVIPNCMVNPTAASAITDMLTRPKPNAASKRLTAFGSQPARALDTARGADGFGLFRGQLRDFDLVAVGVVFDQYVTRHGVVVLVEVVLAAGAYESNRLAGLERSDSVLIRVDDRGAAHAICDVDDP